METLDVAVTVNRGATTTAGRKRRKCEKWFNALMEEQPEIVIAVMQVGGTYISMFDVSVSISCNLLCGRRM